MTLGSFSIQLGWEVAQHSTTVKLHVLGLSKIVNTHQPTIAVIDDDESIRTALRRLLQTSGYSVETFVSAESFLECSAANHTDCLILDLRLAGASGLELQQQLLDFKRRIPVVFITSHDDQRSRQLAMQAGAVDFLDKPFDIETLLDTIQKALEQI